MVTYNLEGYNDGSFYKAFCLAAYEGKSNTGIRGRREKFGGISCEKSRFYAKKYFYQF
jgi:hypothetical protein